MIYIDYFKLPSQEIINNYYSQKNYSVYPWTIFFKNCFEWINCKDITIFYGNNGSGKSTVLNIIAEKIGVKRNNELFKDVIYTKFGEIHPFDDFVDTIFMQLSFDDNGENISMPKHIELITSDDIFKKINNRLNHNIKALMEIEETRKRQKEIINKGYTFHNMNDYDDLVKLVEARKLSKKKYAEIHASKKEKMLSNGETALDIYSKAFVEGGIYFLDEPENCLSPLFQIELIKLIQEAVKYYNCQFFICTHSPLILSLSNFVIYNLDLEPVISKKWEELENVKIYYDFFQSKSNKFKK